MLIFLVVDLLQGSDDSVHSGQSSSTVKPPVARPGPVSSPGSPGILESMGTMVPKGTVDLTGMAGLPNRLKVICITLDCCPAMRTTPSTERLEPADLQSGGVDTSLLSRMALGTALEVEQREPGYLSRSSPVDLTSSTTGAGRPGRSIFTTSQLPISAASSTTASKDGSDRRSRS